MLSAGPVPAGLDLNVATFNPRRLIVIPEVYDGIVSSLVDVPEVHFYACLAPRLMSTFRNAV